MPVAAISVLANDRAQALLIREGGWPTSASSGIVAREATSGVEILAADVVIGMAPGSALASLVACSEFHLGAVLPGDRIATKPVRLVVASHEFGVSGPGEKP